MVLINIFNVWNKNESQSSILYYQKTDLYHKTLNYTLIKINKNTADSKICKFR